MPAKPQPTATEAQEQTAVVAYFRTVYPAYDKAIRLSLNGVHLPNNGAAQMARLKRQGLTVGESDLAFLVSRGGWHGIAMEMKAAKGGRLSPLQQDYLNFCTGEGYLAVCCHGADEAIKLIDRYMKGEIKREGDTA